FRRNGGFAGEADAVMARIQSVERLFDHTQLGVIQAVEAKGHEFVVRNLGLIVLRHATEPRHGVELRAERREHFLALLQQHPPVEFRRVRSLCSLHERHSPLSDGRKGLGKVSEFPGDYNIEIENCFYCYGRYRTLARSTAAAA